MNRILVPVDFSEASVRGLELALALGARLDAAIEVLHVWTAPAYIAPSVGIQTGAGEPVESLETIAKRDAEHKMRALFERVGRADLFPYARIAHGTPVSVILEVAKACDLLVVGTHQRHGLRRFWLGSVAEKLVRLSPIPVLTVPGGEEEA